MFRTNLNKQVVWETEGLVHPHQVHRHTHICRQILKNGPGTLHPPVHDEGSKQGF